MPAYHTASKTPIREWSAIDAAAEREGRSIRLAAVHRTPATILRRIRLPAVPSSLIAVKAKENQVVRKGKQATTYTTSQISVNLKSVDTQKEVASAAGVSHD